MNRALVFIASLIIFLATSCMVMAETPASGIQSNRPAANANWWNQWNIWSAINEINSEISDIWDSVQNLEDEVGEMQDNQGLSCWDLNKNGKCNKATEDINKDGKCNLYDCRGKDGLNGTNGIDCWDLNQDRDCDAADEDKNLDGQCNVSDCKGGYGESAESDPVFTAWDKDYTDLSNRPDLEGWDKSAADDFQCFNMTSCYPNLDTDKTDDQKRVAGSCIEGESIRAINENGSVTCEKDDNTIYDDSALVGRVSSLETTDPQDYDQCSDVDSCGYIKSYTETDPKIDLTLDGKWCVGTGMQVTCNQDAPSAGSETDPQVGALTNGKWCKSDGSQINCEEDAPQVLPSAMIIGGGSDKDVTDGVMYIAAFYADFSLLENAIDQVIPVGGTLSKLNVRLNADPGSEKSYVFMIRRNGANTTLTCTISGSLETSCTDANNQVAFAAGDTIALQSTAINNPSDRTVRWTAKFQ